MPSSTGDGGGPATRAWRRVHSEAHPEARVTVVARAAGQQRPGRGSVCWRAGTFAFSVLDNGVVSNERWTIVDVCEDLSWALFFYAGAASVAGQAYTGAVLATPTGAWPAPSQQVGVLLEAAGPTPDSRVLDLVGCCRRQGGEHAAAGLAVPWERWGGSHGHTQGWAQALWRPRVQRLELTAEPVMRWQSRTPSICRRLQPAPGAEARLLRAGASAGCPGTSRHQAVGDVQVGGLPVCCPPHSQCSNEVHTPCLALPRLAPHSCSLPAGNDPAPCVVCAPGSTTTSLWRGHPLTSQTRTPTWTRRFSAWRPHLSACPCLPDGADYSLD